MGLKVQVLWAGGSRHETRPMGILLYIKCVSSRLIVYVQKSKRRLKVQVLWAGGYG